MAHLNRFTIIGNATRDAVLKKTTSGMSMSNFAVAVEYRWKSKEGVEDKRVDFFEVAAWGKLADIAAQFVRKGSQVFCEGRLQNRSWKTPEGTEKHISELVLEKLLVLDAQKGPAYSQAPKATHDDVLEMEQKINVIF